ncbi:thylakoid lumenal 16.5 kDa protein, chloroplastic [Nymphaea colorata]|nr:thylakoid lumenal 16.5 kDa protein, chloroplastic [Nymphaea colorata]
MAAFSFSSSFPVCSSLPRTTVAPSSSPPVYLSAYHDAESAETTTTRPAFLNGVSRRHALLSLSFSSLTLSIAGFSSAAILEADDDEELLEKAKRDRKKRLEKQGVINSSKNETVYLQELVYKLSKVGQAIENNDLSAAGAVLGPNTESDWVKNVSAAFNKLSSSSEEKGLVDTFYASLASLISSVAKQDVNSSKIAFVSSATALEKWTSSTGLAAQLKGL